MNGINKVFKCLKTTDKHDKTKEKYYIDGTRCQYWDWYHFIKNLNGGYVVTNTEERNGKLYQYAYALSKSR